MATLTEDAQHFVLAVSGLSESVRDLSSALIDEDYRRFVDGHLTHRIGNAPTSKLR